MLYAAAYLNKSNDCFIYGFDNIGAGATDLPAAREGELFDAAVLPLPASRDGETVSAPFHSKEIYLRETESFLAKGGVIFSGKTFPALEELCVKNGFRPEDYFLREELQIKNALPTAEGALEIMLRELPITVYGSRTLIIGFGRIGKAMARILTSLGAKVTVCARNPAQRAEAEISRCEAKDFSELDKLLESFDCAVNTVPAPVLDARRTKMLKKDCLVIDLASQRGTADAEGVKTIHALSLPGKTAPVCAGRIIGETIESIMRERETLTRL